MPIKFTANTVTKISKPGMNNSERAFSEKIKRLAFTNILPHEGVGGCTPSPRNESAVSVRMTPPICKDAATMIGDAYTRIGKLEHAADAYRGILR